MKNYTESDIQIIKKDIENFNGIIHDAIKWSDLNLKYEEKNAVDVSLKYKLNILRNIFQNIQEKPAIALFGGSQVGKSYLIKNLLSDDDYSFSIQDGEVSYDFLQQINPSGNGAESTGVVTRFTLEETRKFEDFPIKVNILSAKDILLIVLDTFFLDLKKISIYSTKDELDRFVQDLEKKSNQADVQVFLTEFDLIEIKKYFESYLSKHSLLLENFKEIHFFERIGKIISKYNSSEWIQLFSVLWQDNNDLSELFSELIRSLENLHFQQNVYIPFKEVLRGGGEIIDVERLNEFYNVHDELSVKFENGQTKSIKRSYLSALISELIFTIPKQLSESKAFLTNSDLLDFPGARSRLVIEQDKLSKDLIPKMLLRGKVSYLFNKYTDEYKINSLLFCTNDKQLEVNEIPYLLYNWIEKNIGSSVLERSKTLEDSKISQLFVIFTFFNNQLEFDTTNDINFSNDFNSLNYKWDTRFHRFFENELVTTNRDWHVNWTKDSPRFKNFYLLRDYKYSSDTHVGYENNGFEKEINPSRVDYLESLKKSFVEHPFVKEHFQDANSSWINAVEPKKDGSKSIVDNLFYVSNNVLKTNHYLGLLNKCIQEAALDLNKYVKSSDLSEIRSANMRMLADIQFSFNDLISHDVQNFNYFIEKISIKPISIYNVINQNIVSEKIVDINDSFSNIEILTNQFPQIKNLSNKEELIDFLKKKLWLNSEEDVKVYLTKYNIDLSTVYQDKKEVSKSKYLIDNCLRIWIESGCNYNSYNEQFKKVISRTQLEFIVNHLSVIIKSRNFDDKITRITESIVNESAINRGAEEFIAETFAILINELINNFDVNYLSKNEIHEIENLGFSLQNREIIPIDDTIIQTIFNLDDSTGTEKNITLGNYIKWIEYFRISLIVNSGFVDFDEHENNNLKEIICKLTPITF